MISAYLHEKLNAHDLMTKAQTFRKISPYIFSNKRSTQLKLLGSALVTLTTSAINVVLPIIFTKTIESMSAEEESVEVLGVKMSSMSLVVTYGGLWTLSQSGYHVRSLIINRLTYDAQNELTNALIVKIGELSFPYRANPTHNMSATSDIIHRSHWYFVELIDSGLLDIVPNVIEIVASVYFIYQYFGPVYVFELLFILSVYSAYTVKATQWNNDALEELHKTYSKVACQLGDSLNNFDTVEYNANLNHEQTLIKQQLIKRKESLSTSGWRGSILSLGQNVTLGIGFTLMLYTYVTRILSSKLTTSDFVLLNTYLLKFVSPVSSLGSYLNRFIKSLTELQAATKLLDEKPLVKEIKHPMVLLQKNHSIRFEQVSFTYPGNKQKTLDNISFEIRHGERVGVVGETGSGKSTITKLLFRFYPVKHGRILIDGHDIHKISLDSLRKQISIVPQDVGMFNRTLRDNIGYGDVEASEEEVAQAITDSQLDAYFASENNSLDNTVGEKGVTLSGGEKQRIGIARALLKKSGINIFDEGTSSLDAQTESNVIEAIERTSKGKTSIIIAHRLSTVRSCDKIIVLAKGQIIQQGTHDELLKQQSGKYAQLWSKQNQPKYSNVSSSSNLYSVSKQASTPSTKKGKQHVYSSTHSR